MMWLSRHNGGRLLATVLTVLGVQMRAPAATAQDHIQSTAEALPVWRNYAQTVLFRIRDWIGADDGVRRVRDAKELPPEVTASVWISEDGTVTRIATHSLDVKAADAIRRAVEGHNVGEGPPENMPQPLRLRFTFKRERGM
jgi:hypothetical protein